MFSWTLPTTAVPQPPGFMAANEEARPQPTDTSVQRRMRPASCSHGVVPTGSIYLIKTKGSLEGLWSIDHIEFIIGYGIWPQFFGSFAT